MTTCILDECNRTPKTRGLCASHYQKYRTAGTLDSVALPSKQPTASKHIMSNVDQTTKTGSCTVCGEGSKVFRRGDVWRCTNKRKEVDSRANLTRHAQYFYGTGSKIDPITAKAERSRLSKEQRGLCKICNIEPATHLDHCHTTGAIRGLLCTRCNTGLGMFLDNTDNLKAAIDYLSQ